MMDLLEGCEALEASREAGRGGSEADGLLALVLEHHYALLTSQDSRKTG